jgi:signal transduction histidine kinase
MGSMPDRTLVFRFSPSKEMFHKECRDAQISRNCLDRAALRNHMSGVTVVFAMTASACLTLALIYAFIWCRQRDEWAYLLFAVASLGTAILAWQDLLLNFAQTTAQFSSVALWSNLSFSIIVLSLAGFVRLSLRAGRMWLLWTVFGLRALSLPLNLLIHDNFYYRKIAGPGHLPNLDETVSSIAHGVASPWLAVGYLSVLALVIFVVDAAVTAWRLGDRRAALSVGGSVVFFVSAATAQAVFIVWGGAQWPSTPSLFFLGMILAMGYELGGEALRAAQLSRDLRASEIRIALEAQAHRSEVAHLLRVASLGELSSALAHELSQPLAAILNNAQAAEILLARDEIDSGEIGQILHDIVTDDKRASKVIFRLRALLKRGEFQPLPLEANDLIQEVLELVHYELMARQVQVVTDFSAGLPPIRGDQVELQQVLINLILNAVDAMSQAAKIPRTLTIRSTRIAGSEILISVADTGMGIPSGREEKIFEPYHTTKPRGLGLGLSLSRSIVVAHGGRLWAENHAPHGATFHFTVPEWRDDLQGAPSGSHPVEHSRAGRQSEVESAAPQTPNRPARIHMIGKSLPIAQKTLNLAQQYADVHRLGQNSIGK